MIVRRAFSSCSFVNFQAVSTLGKFMDNTIPVTHVPASGEFPIMSKEEIVGMTAFVGSHPKVIGSIKQSSSHLHITEMDPNGKLVQLTDISVPEKGPNNPEWYLTHCVLYTMGLGTFKALSLLAKELSMPMKNMRYVTLQERRAYTSQRISIPKTDARDLMEISSTMWMGHKIHLGNFHYEDQAVRLGQSSGNHFKMLLTNVQIKDTSSSPSDIHEAIKVGMKSLKNFGFINYIGLERLDRQGVPHFAVGKAVLQMKWEEVFDMILTSKVYCNHYMKRVKKLWLPNRDPNHVLNEVPGLHKEKSMEALLLKGLAYLYTTEGGGNWARAYESVPASVRNQYISAFQCFLWNHVASYRIQKFGRQVIPGDYVLSSDDSLYSNNTLDTPAYKDDVDKPYGVGKDLEDDGRPTGFTKLKILTEEDTKAVGDDGRPKYSIFDVVLPAPGKELPSYSHPVIQDYYEKLLIANELDPYEYSKTPPQDSDRTKPIGAFYRHLIVKPKNVRFQTLSYTESDKIDFETFIRSDYDKLLDAEGMVPIKTKAQHPTGYQESFDENEEKVCAVLEFSLPTSSNCTVAVREVVDYAQADGWERCNVATVPPSLEN